MALEKYHLLITPEGKIVACHNVKTFKNWGKRDLEGGRYKKENVSLTKAQASGIKHEHIKMNPAGDLEDVPEADWPETKQAAIDAKQALISKLTSDDYEIGPDGELKLKPQAVILEP